MSSQSKEDASCTIRKINVNGSASGVEWVFRVAGMNADPSGIWNESVSKLAI